MKMQKIDFGKNWTYKRADVEDTYKEVTLPHDAMLCEKRSIDNPGIHNLGYFEGHDYEYKKTFNLPEDYADKDIIFEFEGAYHSPEIYINGKLSARWDYGYTERSFAPDNLKFGEEKENANEIKVIVRNADQPNSRWYSGSGIYRPVWMYVADKDHIELNSIRVRTIDVKASDKTYTRGSALIGISAETTTHGPFEFAILSKDGDVINSGVEQSDEEAIVQLEDVLLWSAKSPALYTLKVKYQEDIEEVTFGIRTLTWDREHGMRVNGKRILLRGACIHSDNQLLGAVTDPDAEERRVKLLKKWGYNAIRSAHNPCSKYLLDACDKYGMYMMDEYVDMWYIHKNKYDYATLMEKNYREDLKSMVEKDYNHPSVIMYSTGNEVAETGQERGIKLTEDMTLLLHNLDWTRPVSCGVNIFFNFLFSMGMGIYSDEKAEKDAKNGAKKKKAVGSEFYNQMAGLFGDTFMKMGATIYPCDVKTRDAYANMDIAGYNYGILRYKKDLKKYPERLILGSETFCKDAYKFYEFAKRHPGVVGDFVWAGQDYIGEAGIGSWEYEDYAPADCDQAGWLTAGSGRLDITGKEIGEAYYTRVAFDREKGPIIAVKPVYQKGKHSPSAWKLSDAIRSWSYRGCEGYEASVEVYARAEDVELFVNGVSVGRKKGKDCIFRFKTPYKNGQIVAISYDKNGHEIGRDELSTAKDDTQLTIKPEKDSVQKGHLSYVRLSLTDSNGVWEPMEKDRIKVSVSGGELVALGNGCPYNPDGYLKDETFTYYGEMLAIVRAGDADKVTITATGSDGKEYTCEIPVTA
ncbi:glycoside hydrolase family 2 protein [Butyrivibrio sp. FCS006]|uniref:glycoside hydrolase family 2 protein n=1 Tax=Butyrivibrio sp. FCS006 TaxID=1280684 RepID=UPI001FA7AC8D|nr:glycoside hydrolase family 2 TIM barrel-domain containing protein [Butyrivibrio sp. FCS006]